MTEPCGSTINEPRVEQRTRISVVDEQLQAEQ
jgi:hypothetical protein